MSDRRYAIAVILTMQAPDEDTAFVTMNAYLQNALGYAPDRAGPDNPDGITADFATGGHLCPADYDQFNTDWDIPTIEWHGAAVPRAPIE